MLQFAPSTYYAFKSRPPCRRRVHDAKLKAEIARIHRENRSLYGVAKVWNKLQQEGFSCGRDRVARLMAELGLRGVTRAKQPPRTTVPAKAAERPADKVKRDFSATASNRLWVAEPHLRSDEARVLLHRVHHRRVQPLHRRLGRVDEPVG